MAPVLAPCKRLDLLDMENRLIDDGFGFLLTLLPRELLVVHNGDFILDKRYRVHSKSPVFAYIDYGSRITFNVQLVNDLKPPKELSLTDWLSRPSIHRLVEFNGVPPLRWHGNTDASAYNTVEWAEQTIALIKYFLLRWASDNDWLKPVPQPDYGHLTCALARLTGTPHYKKEQIRFEDDNVIDVCRTDMTYTSEPVPIPDRQANFASISLEHAGHAWYEYNTTNSSFLKAGVDNDVGATTRLLTPEDSPKDTAVAVSLANTTEKSPRDSSVPHSVGADLALPPDSIDAVLPSDANKRSLCPLPTPETSREESIAGEVDATMAELQKGVGSDMLQYLPGLASLTFKRVHQDQPGFLPVRMLIATLRDPIQPHRDGSEVWASFKMHDKGARAAPRMHTHAFRVNSNDIIDENLNIKTALPDLELDIAFNGVHGGGRLEELQLKALVKYYFILAANAKLYGFSEHHMPVNGSFIDQLKIVCKRVQAQAAGGDQRPESRSHKRLKRQDTRNDRAPDSFSDVEDDATANTRGQDGRRSSRRLGHTSSNVVSDCEDNGQPGPVATSQRTQRRELALGKALFRRTVDVYENEFLDPDAEPVDSDGESGDEIPAGISQDEDALLKKRKEITHAMDSSREMIRDIKNRKESTTMSIRKYKGMLNRTESLQQQVHMQHILELRNQELACVKSQLEVREKALKGYKMRKKELDKEVRASIEEKVVVIWEALRR